MATSLSRPVAPHLPPHVCLGCGCTCDDINWHTSELSQSRACPLGIDWFQQARSEAPVAQIEGRPSTCEEALRRAQEILDSAKHPLVTGLQTTTSEAQRVACELADRWGAIFDSTGSPLDADSTIAFQTSGAVTATLGEVAQRADVVLLWGCDLATDFPRHFERYSLNPTSPWLPQGANQRTLVVVDDQANQSARFASQHVQIAPGHHYESLVTLRSILGDRDIDADRVGQATGVEHAQWQALARRMSEARFGAVIYGKRIATGFGESVGALTQCMVELTRSARWVAIPAGTAGNSAGAIAVATWQSGYPLGVEFAHGYPQYGTEWLSERVLENHEVDAVLIVEDDLYASLGPEAQESLSQLPTIVFDWKEGSLAQNATVRFRTARPVVECGGSVYRIDGVCLPVRPAQSTNYPTTESLLRDLVQRIGRGGHGS